VEVFYVSAILLVLLISVGLNVAQAAYSRKLMERLTNPPKSYFEEQALRVAGRLGKDTAESVAQAADVIRAAQSATAPDAGDYNPDIDETV